MMFRPGAPCLQALRRDGRAISVNRPRCFTSVSFTRLDEDGDRKDAKKACAVSKD